MLKFIHGVVATTYDLALLSVLPLLVVGACTLTGSNGQPVVLTTANAPDLIKQEMAKGCPTLMAVGNVAKALSTTVAALQSMQGDINNVSNAASIGCSLLVQPPAAAT